MGRLTEFSFGKMSVKILHQVWVQGEEDLPEDFRRKRRVWRDTLPESWEMILWDGEMAKKQWPDYAEVESLCSHHAMRADLILARCLRDLGGLVTGTDVEPNKPEGLLTFIENFPTMVLVDPHEPQVSNGLVWSEEPRHPFIECVCRHQLRDKRILKDRNVSKITGPECWWDALKAKKWDLCLATTTHAYTSQWRKGYPVNHNAWVDPCYASSWNP